VVELVARHDEGPRPSAEGVFMCGCSACWRVRAGRLCRLLLKACLLPLLWKCARHDRTVQLQEAAASF
jgi:hypothetical protein